MDRVRNHHDEGESGQARELERDDDRSEDAADRAGDSDNGDWIEIIARHRSPAGKDKVADVSIDVDVNVHIHTDDDTA